MKIEVIGIDCSTEPRKTGIALGIVHGGQVEIIEAEVGGDNIPIAETLFKWINRDDKVLIAIDAPLGWPITLSNTLINHHAGQRLRAEPDDLFRRTTDKVIKNKVGKTPLDVGSDRIARTAYAALELIRELEEISGLNIHLAWDKNLESRISVIEVYPSATLKAHNIRSNRYKGLENRDARSQIIEQLKEIIKLPKDLEKLERNADVLDAVICILAADDFLIGDVIEPEDKELAYKEGWIWVKPRD